MAYHELDDEQKLEEAIRFVALGHTLPVGLETFLKDNNLYSLVVQPDKLRHEQNLHGSNT